MTPKPPAGPRAILFDLDDTILAYGTTGAAGWRRTCEHFAPHLPAAVAAALEAAIQRQADWYWSDAERHRRGRLDLCAARAAIVAAALEALGAPDPDLARDMARMRTELHARSIEPFPGALETLRNIKRAGIDLGMITNGSAGAQREKIRRFGLEAIFDVILVEEEFGCGKPDERVFRHALQALRTEPSGAWMVGDSLLFDMAPAQALGMTGVWHDWRGDGLPADAPCRPHLTIRRIGELDACFLLKLG
jgi:putative hydrolase of the HAD superfamily